MTEIRSSAATIAATHAHDMRVLVTASDTVMGTPARPVSRIEWRGYWGRYELGLAPKTRVNSRENWDRLL